MFFWALVVLLVPSSAWSVDTSSRPSLESSSLLPMSSEPSDPPVPSPSGSPESESTLGPSPSGDSSGSPESPEPSLSGSSSDSPSISPPSGELTDASGPEDPELELLMVPEVGDCSLDSPCVVTISAPVVGFLLAIGLLTVVPLWALLVTTWGRDA